MSRPDEEEARRKIAHNANNWIDDWEDLSDDLAGWIAYARHLEADRDFHSHQRELDKNGYESIDKVLRERISELEVALEPFAIAHRKFETLAMAPRDFVKFPDFANAARVLRKGEQP